MNTPLYFSCFRYPVYPLTKFIQQYVPSAKLVEEIGQDIIFVLPGSGFSKIIAFSPLNSEKKQNIFSTTRYNSKVEHV